MGELTEKGAAMQKSREETLEVSMSSRMVKVPWWALIICGVGLFLLYLILANPNYHDTFNYLRAGISMTLYITMLAFPIATVIGLITGLMRTSKNVALFTISTIYVEVIRGIPLVVLILMVAFALVPLYVDLTKSLGDWGLARFGPEFLGGIFQSMADYSIRTIPMEIRAVIALAVGYGAFEAEIFRAGIQSISRGQMEAARSLGMSYFQSMRFIILPQAIRRVLPPLGNDFIAMLKDIFAGDGAGGERADADDAPAARQHVPGDGSVQCGGVFVSIDDAGAFGGGQAVGKKDEDRGIGFCRCGFFGGCFIVLRGPDFRNLGELCSHKFRMFSRNFAK